MKWFIKALRHYADFSGRARRKEYWMFTLFNVIFLFAWTFLLALFLSRSDNFEAEAVFSQANMSWTAMLLLPGLAVAVRRLHDTGKSGWMLLIGLIPLVGWIWLLVLMLTDGQQGRNSFGINPKELTGDSPESFTDKAKLQSAGITLSVAAAFTLLSCVLSATITMAPLTFILPRILANGLMLASGIMLLGCGEREKTRSALSMLLIAAGIIVVECLLQLRNFGSVIHLFFNLSVVMCTAVLLLRAQNEKFVRYATLSVIVLAGTLLLWNLNVLRGGVKIDIIWNIMRLFGNMLMPVALLLFAWTFLSKKEEPVVALSLEATPRGEANETVVYRPSSAPAGSPPQRGSSGKSLGWKILGIFVSIGLILGGLSGELVLRGTDSSTALIVVGVLFLITDIISLTSHNKSDKKKKEYERLLAEGAINSVELSAPATIRVVRDSSVLGMAIPYHIYLNHVFAGKVKNGKSLDIQTYVSHNIITVFDNQDNAFKGDFSTELEAGGYAEVHVKAGMFVKKDKG